MATSPGAPKVPGASVQCDAVVIIMWCFLIYSRPLPPCLCYSSLPASIYPSLLPSSPPSPSKSHDPQVPYPGCGVQCQQQRAGEDQDPGEELHRSGGLRTLQTVVRTGIEVSLRSGVASLHRLFPYYVGCVTGEWLDIVC